MIPAKYPIAVENQFYNVTNTPDLITPKLDALRAYQHSIDAPKPPAGSFDKFAAFRGRRIFFTKAKCDNCHKYPLYADNVLHTGEEIGIDNFEAMRSPTGKYIAVYGNVIGMVKISEMQVVQAHLI